MKQRSADIFHQQLGKILAANDQKTAHNELSSLVKLADILDKSGDESGADHVDKVAADLAAMIKQSQWWTGLLGGSGGALQTLWDRSKAGKELFNKDAIVDIVTNFLMTGGIALLTSELVDVLEQHIPVLKWFAGKSALNFVVKGALTYAIANSNIVHALVEGIEQQAKQLLHIPTEERQQAAPPAAKPMPAPTYAAQPPKPAQEEGSTSMPFNIEVGG